MRGAVLRWYAAAAFMTSALLWAGDGNAKPSRQAQAAARAHADAGLKAYRKGEYETAIERLRAAEDLVSAPTHRLYLARAYAKLGRLREAREIYRSIVEEKLGHWPPRPFREAQRDARKEIEQVEAGIPRIAITVAGPPKEKVHMTIDGEPVGREALSEPIELDPGRYTIRVSADGYEPKTDSISLDPGEGTRPVTFTLVRLPSDEDEEDGDTGPSDVPVPAAVFIGVGAAGLVAGAVMGGLAIGRADDLRDRCPTSPCPTENESLAREANTLADWSTMGLVVGGIVAATGTTWLVWEATDGSDDKPDESRTRWRVAPRIGLGTVELRGRF